MGGQKNMKILAYSSWDGIEERACGEKIFNVEKFKSITSYPYCSNDHPIVGRFWRVFESLTEHEKA